MSANGKSVLMILPSYAFRDKEYLVTRQRLEADGIELVVASTVKDEAEGNMGTKVKPDLMIDDADPSDYRCVVLVGGHGASQFWHDRKTHDILRALDHDKRPIAAIDRAPVSLGVAGIIKGKNVTGHMSIYEKLINYGANYTGKKIERDGHIITAEGVSASAEFARAINEVLAEK